MSIFQVSKDALSSEASVDPLLVTVEDVKPLLACRGCLVTEQPLRPLDDKLSDAYGLLISAVQESDIYPKFICTYCRGLLLKFTAFRERCLFAQTALTNIHSIGIPITMKLIKSCITISYPLQVTDLLHISLVEEESQSQKQNIQENTNSITQKHSHSKEVNLEEEIEVVLEPVDDVIMLSDTVDNGSHDSDDTDIPDCLRGINSDIYKKDTKRSFKVFSSVKDKQVKPSSSNQIKVKKLNVKKDSSSMHIKVNKLNSKKAEEKKPKKLKVEESDSMSDESDWSYEDNKTLLPVSFESASNVAITSPKTESKPLKIKVRKSTSTDKVDKNCEPQKGQGLNLKKVRAWINKLKSERRQESDDDNTESQTGNPATNKISLDGEQNSELDLDKIRSWAANIKANRIKEESKLDVQIEIKPTRKTKFNVKKRTEFENKYNMRIVVLSKEEQIQQVIGRKDSSRYRSTRFKCELCYYGFNTKVTFENHMARHKPVEGSVICEICKFYIQRRKLYVHMNNCHKYDFLCNQCGDVIKSSQQAKTHYRSHKGVLYDCKICGLTFKKPNSVSGHMKLSHATVQCSICNLRCNGENGLKCHMALTHKQALGAVCSDCGVQFHNVEAMHRHRPSGVCDHSHSPCAACGIGFPSDLHLRQHKPECEGRKEYTCEVCSDKFDDVERYFNHMHKHQYHGRNRKDPSRPKKSFMCEMCGESYSLKQNLVNHLMLHSGKTPYQCDYCGSGFDVKQCLQKHIKSHMVNKVPSKKANKYHCQVCNLMFRYRNSWVRHEKMVHQILRYQN